MPYSAFTSISQRKKAFGLTTKEGDRFIPTDLEPIIPDPILIERFSHGGRYISLN